MEENEVGVAGTALLSWAVGLCLLEETGRYHVVNTKLHRVLLVLHQVWEVAEFLLSVAQLSYERETNLELTSSWLALQGKSFGLKLA